MDDAADLCLDRPQLKQFFEALLKGYPTVADLTMMIRLELDENLEALAGSKEQPLAHLVFNLLMWGEAQGRLGDLLRAALGQNPTNPALRALVVAVGATSAQALAAPEAGGIAPPARESENVTMQPPAHELTPMQRHGLRDFLTQQLDEHEIKTLSFDL